MLAGTLVISETYWYVPVKATTRYRDGCIARFSSNLGACLEDALMRKLEAGLMILGYRTIAIKEAR